MPGQACFESIQALRTRVATLNANGSPLAGNNLGYVSDALIKVDIDPDWEDGKEYTLRNGGGNICGFFRSEDRFKGVALELELCNLDYELISMMVPGTFLIRSGASIAGIEWPDPASTASQNGICVEFWSLAWDVDVQATPTVTGSALTYHHHVFPKVKFQHDKYTLQEDFATFPIKGYGRVNPKITADGPFNDWPTWVKNFGGIYTPGGVFFDSAIPAAACGSIAVTSAAS